MRSQVRNRWGDGVSQVPESFSQTPSNPNSEEQLLDTPQPTSPFGREAVGAPSTGGELDRWSSPHQPREAGPRQLLGDWMELRKWGNAPQADVCPAAETQAHSSQEGTRDSACDSSGRGEATAGASCPAEELGG